MGWSYEKDGKTYVRWNTLNEQLVNLGFSQQVAKENYIHETLLYLLGMKANNETARAFQIWIAKDVLPAIRKNGSYGKDNKFEIAKLLASCKSAKAVTGILTLYNIREEPKTVHTPNHYTQTDSVSDYAETMEDWQLTQPTQKEVYQDYCAYCRSRQIMPFTQPNFTRKLRLLKGFIVTRRRVNGELTYFFS